MTRPILAAEFAAHEGEVDACWKRIGVQGDQSCSELARRKHCRNCPSFSAAAAALLDRSLPGGAAIAPTGQLAAAAGDADAQSVIIFRIGREWFALPTLAVDEVVAARRIHSLPHRRNPALLGLVNVRGELVICLSLAQLLAAPAESALEGRLIVARHPGGRLAFPVDEVQHTQHYSAAELEDVPATVAKSVSSFTRGLLRCRDRLVGRLDERLLFDALAGSLT